MIWTPDLPNDRDYFITVSPLPPYGPDEIITSTTSAMLSLYNSIPYNITISSNTCPDRITTTFIFGKINKHSFSRLSSIGRYIVCHA